MSVVSKPKLFGGALIALLLAAILVQTMRRDYWLGGVHFKLPAAASVQRAPLQIQMLRGLDDDSREMLVLLPADYVAKHVPGYVVQDGQVREDVTLLISALTPEELQRYRHDPLVQKMAAKTDMFEDRHDIYDAADRSWHVFGFGGPAIFALMRIDPASTDDLGELQSNWLGYCIQMEMTATETGKTWSCESSVVVGRLAAGFHYGPKNLKNYDALAAFVRQSLTQWIADAQ